MVMNLTIVIPVYNERLLIKDTLWQLKKRIKEEFNLILVDDYSTDGTYRLIEETLPNFQNLKLVTNRYEKGFGNALRTGFEEAASDGIVVVVMADLSDELEIIPQMYIKILEGCDIVCASRYIKGGKRQGGPILKAFLSRYGSWLIHKITKIPATDLANSFKAYRKSVLENLLIKSNGFEISMEIVLKAYLKGYKIAEIPTRWRERTTGQSHFAILRDGIKFVKWFIFGCVRLLSPK
jgi:glycosyltransferase involved in cell wall biosynthesis